MSPWEKPDWQDELERDEADPYIEALTDVAVVVLVLVVSLICAWIAYQMLSPIVNEIISNWSFVP